MYLIHQQLKHIIGYIIYMEIIQHSEFEENVLAITPLTWACPFIYLKNKENSKFETKTRV